MKTKLIEKISAVYGLVENEESAINEQYKNTSTKMGQLELGSKMLKINALNTQLLTLLDVYFNIFEGDINDLSEEVANYYKTIENLSNPISENDTEEIKKFKEVIQQMKADNGKKK